MEMPWKLIESRLKSSKLYFGEPCRRIRMLLNADTKVKTWRTLKFGWLRNVTHLIPKKKVIEKLEGQTRGIRVQSVLAKCYCGCLIFLMEMEMKNLRKREKAGRIPGRKKCH